MLVKKIAHRVISLYKRQDHIKYARSLGVKVGEASRFVDNPTWGSEPYLISIGDHVLISGKVTFLIMTVQHGFSVRKVRIRILTNSAQLKSAIIVLSDLVRLFFLM